MSALRHFVQSTYSWILVNILHRGRLTLGKGSIIEPGVFFSRNGRLTIGDHTRIRKGTIIMCQNGEIEIGSNVTINQNCVLHGYGNIYIGDHALIAPNVAIYAGNHVMDDLDVEIRKQGMTSKGPVRIARNVWLGTKCVILDGIEVGEGAVIGAGSIVTKTVAPNMIAVGNPARVVRSRETVVPLVKPEQKEAV